MVLAPVSGHLRTFCHISEYDEAGYRALHRLVAASDPLVLWAPSSKFLTTPGCRVQADEFLDLVEKGQIQVVAREEWLESRHFRESHKWEGARWDPRVDGALRRMFRDDGREPDLRRRRVAAAPDEAGHEKALQMVEEEPGVVAEIESALKDERRRLEIPPGTLATAARRADDLPVQTEIVLRDAYNHAEAIDLSRSRTAILLGPGDGVFSQRVAAIFAQDMASKAEYLKPTQAQHAPMSTARLSRQLIDLLARLEAQQPNVDLGSFMSGEGHRELVEWSREVMDLLVDVDPAQLQEKMVGHLTGGLKAGSFSIWPPEKRTDDVVNAAIGVAGALEGPKPIALLGLAFAVKPFLRAAARAADRADSEFSGPKWPFRYLWDTGPRRSGRQSLLEVLEA